MKQPGSEATWLPEQRVPRVLKPDDTFMFPAIDDLLLETDRRRAVRRPSTRAPPLHVVSL